jgi:hypothetical protein
MRRDEGQFWREFEQARLRIFGALLDAISAGLRNLPNVRLDELPRMADFAIWISACEESLGMKPGEALTTYQSNRAETHHLALESSPLYEPVAELAREGFSGTVAELLARLNCMISKHALFGALAQGAQCAGQHVTPHGKQPTCRRNRDPVQPGRYPRQVRGILGLRLEPREKSSVTVSGRQ